VGRAQLGRALRSGVGRVCARLCVCMRARALYLCARVFNCGFADGDVFFVQFTFHFAAVPSTPDSK